MNKVYKDLQISNATTHSGKRTLLSWKQYTHIIPENIKKEIYGIIQNAKDNKLTDNSIVYRSSLSTLPPYKLKSYITDNKLDIKTARKWEKIDTVIIDEIFINQFFEKTRWDWRLNQYVKDGMEELVVIPTEALLDNNKIKQHIAFNQRPLDALDYTIESPKCTHFIIRENEFQEMINTNPAFTELKMLGEVIRGQVLEKEHGSKPLTDACDFLLDFANNISSYKTKVVLDSSVNNEINKGLIIDSGVFQNLYNMLNSTDTSNYEMAKEIIANCEFDASKPYIVALYNIFPELRKSTMNKNYKIVQKILDKSSLNIRTSTRYGTPTFDHLLSFFGEKCPELLPNLMPCLVYHINIISKSNLIKEIILH
jgi:hypothetical protein